VILTPSIEVASVSPVVTARSEDVTFAASPGACSEGEHSGVQVKGFNASGSANETETFSIVVP
jgi:hypothetical protein